MEGTPRHPGEVGWPATPPNRRRRHATRLRRTGVDGRIVQLEAKRRDARARIEQVDARARTLAAEVAEADAQLREVEQPSYRGLGLRIEQLLRLAEQQARDVMTGASRDAHEMVAQARQEADQLLAAAQAESAALAAAAEQERDSLAAPPSGRRNGGWRRRRGSPSTRSSTSSVT